MIEYIDVTRSYTTDDRPAVRDVSLRVDAGELCVLLGASGSGKTTLLRMANRLIEPTSGTILVDGRDVRSEDPVLLRRRIGYVIQNVGLFPHWNVARNVATTLELTGVDKARRSQRVDELLELVQLDPARYRDRYPSELSGGEQQRVGVARALAADPPLLLMDEPFGAIDPINRAEIQRSFLDLQRRLRKTVLFVSHDIDEALLLGDTIALMHQGAVVQHGTPMELLRAPADEYVTRFFGGEPFHRLMEAIRTSEAIDVECAFDSAAPAIDGTAPLRDALYRLLDTGAAALQVDRAGTPLGMVTIRSIRSTLHSMPHASE